MDCTENFNIIIRKCLGGTIRAKPKEPYVNNKVNQQQSSGEGGGTCNNLRWVITTEEATTNCVVSPPALYPFVNERPPNPSITQTKMMLENYDSLVSVLYIQVPPEGCHSNMNKILVLLHNVNQLSGVELRNKS